MSLPPLPDVFGNYTLGDSFTEVLAPPGIDWLPQTAGWYWLGAALGALLAWRGWLRLRRWWRNRYRREAAARLAGLAARPGDEYWLTELNRLLKITAMAAYSRERVAPLYGPPWVDFLNGSCPQPPFDEAASRLLARGPYRSEVPADAQRRALLDAVREWVDTHAEAPRV